MRTRRVQREMNTQIVFNKYIRFLKIRNFTYTDSLGRKTTRARINSDIISSAWYMCALYARVSARRYACTHNSRLSRWPSEHVRGILSRAIASRGGQSAVLSYVKKNKNASFSLSAKIYFSFYINKIHLKK